MYVSDGKYTHYLYYPGHNGLREPTGLLCLGAASQKTRRAILHNALKNGELLAKVPTGVADMKTLRSHLTTSGH